MLKLSINLKYNYLCRSNVCIGCKLNYIYFKWVKTQLIHMYIITNNKIINIMLNLLRLLCRDVICDFKLNISILNLNRFLTIFNLFKFISDESGDSLCNKFGQRIQKYLIVNRYVSPHLLLKQITLRTQWSIKRHA